MRHSSRRSGSGHPATLAPALTLTPAPGCAKSTKLLLASASAADVAPASLPASAGRRGYAGKDAGATSAQLPPRDHTPTPASRRSRMGPWTLLLLAALLVSNAQAQGTPLAEKLDKAL